ncbi:MAG: DHH family phosphoesterase, partial [Candidatus Bathyarchaeota archaeon]
MQIQKITSLINKINAESAVLLCHHNADPDALCSAFAFSKLLTRLHPKLSLEIAAAQGPSRLSKHLLNSLPVKLTAEPHIKEADAIILLDTNTIQQLNGWSKQVEASDAPIIAIDHHAGHPDMERLATIYVAEDEASSTCEIVYRFFKEAEVRIEEAVAKALFLGIAYDTRHFILANSNTFKAVADLIEAGADAKETLALLSLPTSYSERAARLKASRRVKVKKIGEWLIALSHIKAYQASAARALVGLGAHVAVVGGKRGGTLRISLRADRNFCKETGLHLGRDIAKPLGEHIHGMGGGHSTSAGVNGTGDVDAGLKRCTELLR